MKNYCIDCLYLPGDLLCKTQKPGEIIKVDIITPACPKYVLRAFKTLNDDDYSIEEYKSKSCRTCKKYGVVDTPCADVSAYMGACQRYRENLGIKRQKMLGDPLGMPREKIIRRIAYAELQKTEVFRTLYRTSSDNWSENEIDGDWKPCCNSPHAAKVCDIRYEHYFLVGGIKYTDLMEAVEVMEMEILLPTVLFSTIDAIADAEKLKKKRTKRVNLITMHKTVVKPCL